MANLKKNLLYNFGLSISQVLIPFVSIPYIARVLDPQGIGRVSFMDSLTYYFVAIAEFGIVVYGTREVSRVKQDRDKLYATVSELLVLHMVTSCCTLLLYGITVFISWQKIQDIRLVFFSLSFLLVNAFACEWYFRGMEAFRYITLRSLFTRLLGLVSIFILVKAPADYYLYYGIIVVAAVANLLLNLWYLSRAVPIRLKGLNWRKHLMHTRFIYFISLTYGITLLLDNVLLRMMSTTVAVGLYAFAVKMVRIATSLITDSLLVFFPRIVSLKNEASPRAVQLVLLRNLQLLIFFAVPLSMGFFLLADELVLVFLGKQFEPAIVDVRILALFPCIKACNLFLGNQVLMSYHEEKAYLKSLLASGMVFIVLTLTLSNWFADKGACVALLLAEAVTCVMNFYFTKKLVINYREVLDGRGLLAAVISSSLFIPVIYWLKQTTMAPAAILTVSVVTCLVLYMLLQLFVFQNTIFWTIREWLPGFLYNRLPPVTTKVNKDEP